MYSFGHLGAQPKSESNDRSPNWRCVL